MAAPAAPAEHRVGVFLDFGKDRWDRAVFAHPDRVAMFRWKGEAPARVAGARNQEVIAASVCHSPAVLSGLGQHLVNAFLVKATSNRRPPFLEWGQI